MHWRESRRRAKAIIAAVVPAGYKALLSADDGNVIILDTLKKGAIIAEGQWQLRKADSNSYVYTASEVRRPVARHRLTMAPGAGA
jgi:hypothetical protein